MLLSAVQTVKSYLPRLVLLTSDVTSSQSAGAAAVGSGCSGSLGYMHRDVLAALRLSSSHHYRAREEEGKQQLRISNHIRD